MTDLAVAFHYEVRVGGQSDDVDARFQEVSGLSAEVGVEEFREGGLNEYVHRLPTGAKYGNLVLKRGIVASSGLSDWCRKAIEEFVFDPRDVEVSLLDEAHEPILTWTFTGAYPLKWSVSTFNAQQNALAIESLELAYRKFRKV
ncbi:MAG: phage tail protein [Ilumatobacter sp.]|uniref:phage tail protein n=1 Tax=Ilumatobacter sp. TaxID=1967498 RepID=UPI002635EB16|nr:phage tail protein [Ilumatobacter sp.]MDJ0768465.1 phage tail protein [Ilumatobacter sp.]